MGASLVFLGWFRGSGLRGRQAVEGGVGAACSRSVDLES